MSRRSTAVYVRSAPMATSGRAACRGPVSAAVVTLLLVPACSPGAQTPPESTGATSSPSRTATPTAEPTPTAAPSSAETTRAETSPPARPVDFSAGRVLRDIRAFAGRIGPREATSPAFYRAADVVERRLTDLGYDVSRQRVRAPAGVSWGVPVDAGRSVNVVADPPGFHDHSPHLVVGAHLDTVPQAPGAEDNASGVGVVLELARLAARAGTRLPVRFVAFGAEEPRGEGEAWHHFGSKRYVDLLDARGRRAMRGMVSLDRVGVSAPAVPVCTGGSGSTAVQRSVLEAARRVDTVAEACVNTGSDHYSFELRGMAAARIGGVSYAAYHSEADRPGVVDINQLERVGRITWSWLSRRSDR